MYQLITRGQRKMNMLEALAAAQESDSWFRPVDWSGTSYAYVVRNGYTHLVPNHKGGPLEMTAKTILLLGEWEVVSPDTVMAEQGVWE
jgi:hypothetical protein